MAAETKHPREGEPTPGLVPLFQLSYGFGGVPPQFRQDSNLRPALVGL